MSILTKIKTLFMKNIISTLSKTFALLVFFSAFGFCNAALAGTQCIQNNSGTSLNIAWYNGAGQKANNDSNANVTLGMKACKTGDNLGYAVIECNGCALAQPFAQAGVGIAGGVLLGACVAATGGECIQYVPDLLPLVIQAVQAIPNSDWKKRVVVPKFGQTVTFVGTAFDLRVQ